jgi:hypothetical protein
MAVALQSLRVTLDGDSSGYVRATAAKIAADDASIASDKARNAAIAQADVAMARAIPGYSSLSKSLLQGYSAGQQFEQQIRKIGNAVDHGLGLDRAAQLIDAAYQKFGLVADATTLARQGFVSIAPAVEAATRRIDAHAEALARATAQSQALAAAERAQAQINQVTGVTGVTATGDRSADIVAYGKALEDLRAKFNPLFAAGKDYKTTLDEINSAAKVGAISETERAAAVTRTKAAFVDQVAALKSAKSATTEVAAATGLTAYEFKNLGFQVNDAITMLASGSSPFQVIATQGGQVQQILSGGAGCVTGSLKSITSYLGSLFTVGRVAFGGVVAGALAAAFAVHSYLDAQRKVQMALTGAGRASGATPGGINNIADQGASTFGLSVSEARELAAALAATGKVANDNILPIDRS